MRINEIIALMIGTVGVLNIARPSTKVQNIILKILIVFGGLWIWLLSF